MRTVTFAILVSILAWSHCGCSPTTGAERTSFPVEVTGSGLDGPVENAMGWSVEITSATASLGPVYFFEGDPLFVERTLIDRLLGIRVAYAHPGHYQEGDALAQILDQYEVDLTAGAPVGLGEAEGVTGDYNSARIGLHPLPTPGAVLGTDTIEVKGVATLGSDEVVFVAHPPVDLDVEGIAFDHEVDGRPGRVLIEVDLQRWFQQADFTDLVGTGGGETLEIPSDSQAMNALMRGVDNTSAFVIGWIDESE